MNSLSYTNKEICTMWYYYSKEEIDGFKPIFEVAWCFVEFDGRILLLQRQDHKRQGNMYGMPAGKLDEWEDARTAVIRETFEETWIRLSPLKLFEVERLNVRYPDYDFVWHAFRIILSEKPEVIINGTEHKWFIWITPKEALSLELVPWIDTTMEYCYDIDIWNKPDMNLEIYDRFPEWLSAKFDRMWPRKEDIKKAFSFFEEPKHLSVLEIWCWSWRDAKEIVRYTQDYLGLDYSEWMLEIAKRANPGLDFIVADICDYVTDKKFDIIFSFASVVHLNKAKIQELLIKLHWMLTNWWVIFISTKYSDEYLETITQDEFGTRSFVHYDMLTIKSLIPDWFSIEYENVSKINSRDWLEIIIKKID